MEFVNIRGSLKVAILRTNPVYADPRVIKEAHSLCKVGFKTLILAWDRELNSTREEKINNLTIVRLRFRAPYGSITLVFHLLIYWIWVIIKLIRWNPSIIHACDLDTVIPAFFYRLVAHKKMIFDMFDSFYLGFSQIQPKYRKLTPIIYALERAFVSKADGFITVSSQLLNIFCNRMKKPVALVMNCPEYYKLPKIHKRRDIFTIVYSGSIQDLRGLKELVDATKEIPNTQIILAGRVFSESLLKSLTASNRNVKYLGVLPYSQSIELQSSADVIPIFFDPRVPISRVAAPNKLFEAMMLGIPVITNIAREIVGKTGCGILVNYGDVEQIRRALLLLKNPTLRKEMGFKGRKAYMQQYNWSVMEKRLLRIYNKLLMY